MYTHIYIYIYIYRERVVLTACRSPYARARACFQARSLSLTPHDCISWTKVDNGRVYCRHTHTHTHTHMYIYIYIYHVFHMGPTNLNKEAVQLDHKL